MTRWRTSPILLLDASAAAATTTTPKTSACIAATGSGKTSARNPDGMANSKRKRKHLQDDDQLQVSPEQNDLKTGARDRSGPRKRKNCKESRTEKRTAAIPPVNGHSRVNTRRKRNASEAPIKLSIDQEAKAQSLAGALLGRLHQSSDQMLQDRLSELSIFAHLPSGSRTKKYISNADSLLNELRMSLPLGVAPNSSYAWARMHKIYLSLLQETQEIASGNETASKPEKASESEEYKRSAENASEIADKSNGLAFDANYVDREARFGSSLSVRLQTLLSASAALSRLPETDSESAAPRYVTQVESAQNKVREAWFKFLSDENLVKTVNMIQSDKKDVDLLEKDEFHFFMQVLNELDRFDEFSWMHPIVERIKSFLMK